MPRYGVTCLALAAVIALGGCHDATDPEIQRMIGRIDISHTYQPVLVAPAEVRAGEEFPLSVYTAGPSVCTRPDGETVEVQGSLVRIVPYDVVPIPGHSDVCPHDIAFHEHRLRLSLPVAGAATLRVVGLRASATLGPLDSVDTDIMVRR
jgi:hypothetical protein